MPNSQDTNVNMFSVIFHVLGFMESSERGKPPKPADSARFADILMCNWIISNVTDEDVTLTFPEGKMFLMSLIRLDTKEEIWKFTYPDSDEKPPDVKVVIPMGKVFNIPKSGEDESQDDNESDIDEPIEVSPIIELRKILIDRNIPEELELAVIFSPNATEFPQQTIFPLWR